MGARYKKSERKPAARSDAFPSCRPGRNQKTAPMLTKFTEDANGRKVEMTAGFAAPMDLDETESIIYPRKDGKKFTLIQKLSFNVLDNLWKEVADYKRRRCFASSEADLRRFCLKKCPEFGAVLIWRVNQQIAGLAFFHVTWKRNVYLDWLTKTQEFLEPTRKTKNFGKFMMETVGIVAWQLLGANLIFIESKKGRAADYYKKTLGLRKRCDFILLAMDFHAEQPGWKVCDQIYGLANSKKPVRLPAL